MIGHVIVALHVVVSDVHHRTFIYIQTHLPLVGPLNMFMSDKCIDFSCIGVVIDSGVIVLSIQYRELTT